MSDTNDSASKTEDASPRKLQQARERGEVVKTPDVAPLFSLVAVARSEEHTSELQSPC